MTETTERHPPQLKPGLLIHAAAGYDALVWLSTLGRERALRNKMLSVVNLNVGETVLDVGCGTGSLAIAAKRRVGPTGAVYGIDASPEMIARAGKKAGKSGVDVILRNGAAQALPFADGGFDVVLSTLMLHHLPRASRTQFAHEMRRVLKPGGRALVIDFAARTDRKKGFFGRFHRHGHVKPGEVLALLGEVGMTVIGHGALGFRSLHFTLAKVPD